VGHGAISGSLDLKLSVRRGVVMLKVGDLVTWTESGDKVFNNYYSLGYKSPGVIVEEKKPEGGSNGTVFHTFKIYWADGQMSSEHSCYIRKVEE
jgi:hypothetical protein